MGFWRLFIYLKYYRNSFLKDQQHCKNHVKSAKICQIYKFRNHKLIQLAIQIRHVRLRPFLNNCLKLMFKARNRDLLMPPFVREQQFEIQFETQLRTDLECVCLFRNSTAPRIQCILKLDDSFQASLQFLFIAQKTWNNLQV